MKACYLELVKSSRYQFFLKSFFLGGLFNCPPDQAPAGRRDVRKGLRNIKVRMWYKN